MGKNIKFDILISIIIPVYNVEKYLSDCINSVLDQTYKNFELILIDDGSKDASGKICDEFAMQDDRISVYHIKNSGVSVARNLGIEKAKGDYIQFIDSDDTIDINMTEELVGGLEEADLVLCGYKRIMHKENKLIIPQKGVYDFKAFQYMLRYWLIDPIIGSPWNKLFNRKILLENNVKYEPNIIYAEDYLFNMRYLKYINTIAVIDKPLYNYNLLTSGSLHQINNKNVEETWRINELIVQEAHDTFIVHGTQESQFVAELYMFFLASNVAQRVQQNSSRKEFTQWILSEVEKNSAGKRYMDSIKLDKIFPGHPRAKLVARFVKNIANKKMVTLSGMIIQLLYKI